MAGRLRMSSNPSALRCASLSQAQPGRLCLVAAAGGKGRRARSFLLTSTEREFRPPYVSGKRHCEQTARWSIGCVQLGGLARCPLLVQLARQKLVQRGQVLLLRHLCFLQSLLLRHANWWLARLLGRARGLFLDHRRWPSFGRPPARQHFRRLTRHRCSGLLGHCLGLWCGRRRCFGHGGALARRKGSGQFPFLRTVSA